MNVAEYRELIHEDIALASQANHSNLDEEFLLYASLILINGDEFDDFIPCHYEGITRRKGNMRIDGYSMDDSDGSCCVFISNYHGPTENDSIKREDISALFKKMRLFIEEAIRTELYHELCGQEEDFARDLYYDNDKITKFRFFIVTDAYNKQRTKTLKDEKLCEKSVELNVWDITRLYDLVISKMQRESVEIKLPEFGIDGLPCVKAVDYQNVVADIDTFPADTNEDGSSKNVVSYSSYLAVVPGHVLNNLYLEYGSKLLEGNVRSFLSVRGKVNKSIQSTIKNYPEMFFAYNNGIAATATNVITKMTQNGLIITDIKDLQIVNGGQTTASIANAILTAKKNEIVNVQNLFVPMKLSVLNHDAAEYLIPKIAEYSNSQNKVDASDFFSNHPFHIRMEGFSRKTPTPSINGNQFQQYWFYERTRGQYNQGKMKFGARSAQLKQYLVRYPEKQVITMLDLAKYMELYYCQPHVVSKGKQKMLQVFADRIKSQWQKSDEDFNAFYYKRVVALAIIYRHTDDIVKQARWYKEKKAYKANIVAYTISILFNHIVTQQKSYEMDFLRIWNTQDIYDELEDQLSTLSYEVYRFITGPRDTENVTEWCKKESCWEKAQSQIWTINDDFIATLIPKELLKSTVQDEKKNQKIANEVDALTEILNRGSSYWSEMLRWGVSNRMLSEKEVSIIKLIINMERTGRIPTDKQAKIVLAARERLILGGMPMQF